jgi:hypothetical protein
MGYEIKGAKLVEIPFLKHHISDRSSTDNILVVGEQIGVEGVIQTIVDVGFNQVVCTDIMAMPTGCELYNITQQHANVKFIQHDFVEFPEDQTFQYIACINVLEHFGMNYAEFHGFSGGLAGDDYIRWNHDLRGIQKMITLLNKNKTAKIIITVPCGQPIFSGDLNQNNKMPMLRRYDEVRINLIKQMVSELNMQLDEVFYVSEDFTTWYETDYHVSTPQYFQLQNPYSPNAIWAFTITHP